MAARKLPREAQETTALVKALQAFGTASTEHPHLDQEDEEVTVGGQVAISTTHKPSSSNDKGKAKAMGDGIQDVADGLGKLELDAAATGSSAVAASKVDHNLRGLLRHSTHTIKLDDGTERVLTSWKMADYAYKRDPCPYPTRARGLFTEQVGFGDNEEYRIVARGYDKFFNVDEVSWTKWDTIGQHSSPPYELTLKSNGCIILIAALTLSHVLVTSKHATGPGDQRSGNSHSQMGEIWLERHLSNVGKTKAQLARELFQQNLTAVAELCDDSFEEHVLPYPPALTGLHLHGLNHNTPTLSTLPSSEVAAFAREWGLIPTLYYTFPSVLAVKTYCDRVREDGGIDGMPVEGFVVRAKSKKVDGSAFFWKVKYDEPYLLYREWREVTRRLLNAHHKGQPHEVRPSKMRHDESKLYLWWADREVRENFTEADFKDWSEGRGIIRTRDKFLEWRKSSEAQKVAYKLRIQTADADAARSSGDFDRTLIVPVAIQGCGKTALSLALTHLFGWGHTQSDDFITKKGAVHFIKSVKTLLEKHSVVIADKNNHIKKLRSDLVAVARSFPDARVRLVALNWAIDSPAFPRDKLHELCASRIEARGANHQTLRAGEGHETALWAFLGQYEPLDLATGGADSEFHEVIEMNPSWSRREALEKVVDSLAPILKFERPSDERITEALDVAQGYKIQVFKEAAASLKERQAKASKPRYFAVSIEEDLATLLAPTFACLDNPPPIWAALLTNRRVGTNPHVTLVHEKELPDKQESWDYYAQLVQESAKAAAASDESTAVDGVRARAALTVSVALGPRIVCDSRVMAIEVSALTSESIRPRDGGAHHVTVGTASQDIPPVEGRLLLDAVLQGNLTSADGGDITIIEIPVKTVDGKIRGLR